MLASGALFGARSHRERSGIGGAARVTLIGGFGGAARVTLRSRAALSSGTIPNSPPYPPLLFLRKKENEKISPVSKARLVRL
jgi:hypothetical protein